MAGPPRTKMRYKHECKVHGWTEAAIVTIRGHDSFRCDKCRIESAKKRREKAKGISGNLAIDELANLAINKPKKAKGKTRWKIRKTKTKSVIK